MPVALIHNFDMRLLQQVILKFLIMRSGMIKPHPSDAELTSAIINIFNTRDIFVIDRNIFEEHKDVFLVLAYVWYE